MLRNLKSQLFRSWVKPLFFSSLFLCIIVTSFVLASKSRIIKAEANQASILIYDESLEPLFSIEKNTIKAVAEPVSVREITTEPTKKINVVITGYSSTVWQTDDTPFTTAAGTPVRNGVVATNFLPFNTKIKIPGIYGERIFVVEDRMSPRYGHRIDIWFPDYRQARNFGVRRAYIEILES